MRRLELVFGAIVTALAIFVAVEARGARVYTGYQGGAVSSAPMATDSDDVAERVSDEPLEEAGTAPRDLEEIRRRIREGSAGTYMDEVLVLRDSALARWPDRRSRPLRVWVQPASPVVNFDPGFPSLVREAFQDWESTGIPVWFSFVSDSARADVHVTWIERFDEQISGKTLWAHDDRWWIVEANIVLAIHHHSGEALDQLAIRAIALHEVGHLIGLDHTADATNIMTPRVRVKTLSPADRATARLLYTLPPGRIK